MPATPPIALYIHIPFCETKCPYCDFNTYARIESLMPAYVAALQKEIAVWGALLGGPEIVTVFFGGGTPSYLPGEDIKAVMDSVRRSFPIRSDAEVTIECNPGDFNERKLQTYLESGVNRLSMGVQTLDDGLLKLLGRRHSVDGALKAYRMAKDAGFDNASFDLMFGLPYQTLAQWASTLEQSIDIAPKHISMYCLTLEGGTPMEHQVKTGLLPEPDSDLAADMYLMAMDRMEGRGYRHYEISNWSFPGYESRHNLVYWRNQPYLGVGPGAHSYIAGCRFNNIKPPREYVKRLESAAAPSSSAGGPDATAIGKVAVVENVEKIERRLEIAETLMMGLRLDVGISEADFRVRFGRSPLEEFPDTFEDLRRLGLVEVAGGAVRLTRQGRPLGNEVFRRFFE
ncbi:MAG: radical SAM family heme chaperone HemW [SAR202 cluster bacterium]|nr:radical SAM family heme chaperone HemW [SAR202 cluster bacterium]